MPATWTDGWDVHLVSIKLSERWRVARLKSLSGTSTKIESWHLIDDHATSFQLNIKNKGSASKCNPVSDDLQDLEIEQMPKLCSKMKSEEDVESEAKEATRLGMEAHTALRCMPRVSQH